MLPTVIDVAAQLTAIDVNGACVTVSVKLFEVIPLPLAVMPADPCATPVASPLLTIVAMLLLEEFQLIWFVTSPVELSL